MRYKKFGNTGVEISVLGFGCMRFPMIRNGSKEYVDEGQTSTIFMGQGMTAFTKTMMRQAG